MSLRGCAGKKSGIVEFEVSIVAVFEYKGFTTEGKNVTGIIDAENPKTARTKLRKAGVYPTEVLQGSDSGRQGAQSFASGLRGWGLGERVGLMDLSVATRQLSTLLGAKLPLMEALTAIVDQIDHRELKRVMASIREQVREGSSLAAALNLYPRVFSDVYVNMVHAGEASGALDAMLLRLADFLEYQVKLRNQLRAAFSYPILMLFAMGFILLFLLTAVVPKITVIFTDIQQALPLPTVILINASNFLRDYWWFLLVVGLATAVSINRYIATPAGRKQFDYFKMRLPVIGRVSLLVALSRFTRTLSTLLASGVPLLSALDVVKKIVHLTPLMEVIEQAQSNVREGEGFADPLKRSGLFPPLITHMIAIGEKSGELEPMLIKVSEAYDNEVTTTITTMTALLGPVMILFMAGIVGFIVLAILLPIFELSQVMG